jgi:hypothetical protein
MESVRGSASPASSHHFSADGVNSVPSANELDQTFTSPQKATADLSCVPAFGIPAIDEEAEALRREEEEMRLRHEQEEAEERRQLELEIKRKLDEEAEIRRVQLAQQAAKRAALEALRRKEAQNEVDNSLLQVISLVDGNNTSMTEMQKSQEQVHELISELALQEQSLEVKLQRQVQLKQKQIAKEVKLQLQREAERKQLEEAAQQLKQLELRRQEELQLRKEQEQKEEQLRLEQEKMLKTEEEQRAATQAQLIEQNKSFDSMSAMLIKGATFMKIAFRQGVLTQKRPHSVFVQLSADLKQLSYVDGENAPSISSSKSSVKTLNVIDITMLHIGQCTEAFKQGWVATPNLVTDENVNKSMSIAFKTRTLDLVASSKEQRDSWCKALMAVRSKASANPNS